MEVLLEVRWVKLEPVDETEDSIVYPMEFSMAKEGLGPLVWWYQEHRDE